jgi:hypothetical protein
MNPEIISACESFAMGKPETAIALMTDTVTWDMAGDQVVLGIEPILKICEAMAVHGNPDLEKTSTIVGGGCVVVEGRSAKAVNGDDEERLRFCDVFRIENEQIAAITSYVVLPDMD